MVYDCFGFWNEKEILYFRLKHLWKYVDKFVIVESNLTHRGIPKDWNFEKIRGEFDWAEEKIIYVKKNLSIENLDINYKGEFYNRNSPFMNLDNQQRNAILDGLSESMPDDIILISDIDEIPSDKAMSMLQYICDRFEVFCFAMQSFSYYFNTTHPDFVWKGTVVGKRKFLNLPQNWRDMRWDINWEGRCGYHFSWIGKEYILSKFKNTAHDEVEIYSDIDHVERCLSPDSEGKFPDLFKRPEMYLVKYDIESDPNYPRIMIEESNNFPNLYYK
jgi:beta-1,4-mannosyl-glycoprotein beta-1,4-N-acetylglucosaminyltransferase